MTRTVLTIQSHVVAGHVGNDAAAFALQRLGVEAWPIYTVQFSNHTGHGAWTGQAFTAEHIHSLLDGLDARGLLKRVDAVLSGYVGTVEIAGAIVDAAARVRQRNPNAVYCCDPVMGDVGRGLFVKPDIPGFFAATALASADIITPNLYELGLLAGTDTPKPAAAIGAVRELLRQGPRIALVTSVRDDEAHIDTLAVTATQAWRVRTPWLDLDPMPSGMGDCTAALFLGHWLQHGDIPQALVHAVSALYELLTHADPTQPRELNLIPMQQALVQPRQRFAVDAIGA